MIPFLTSLFSKARQKAHARHLEEARRVQLRAKEAFDAADDRGDTRDKHHCLLRLADATADVLRLEVLGMRA